MPPRMTRIRNARAAARAAVAAPDRASGDSLADLERLARRLDGRAKELAVYDRYARGDQPLAYASPKFREAFGHLFGGFSDNFMGLVVEAEAERLNVEGFRIGTGRDRDDEEPPPTADAGELEDPTTPATRDGSGEQDETVEADEDARRIWQANQLDAESATAHYEMLVKGAAYTLVWPDPAKRDTPRITIEDALEMITEHDPQDRRKVRVALKRWIDEAGHYNATLYYADRLEKYRSERPVAKANAVDGGWELRTSSRAKIAWVKREIEGEAWPLDNPIGQVPVTPLRNRPRLDGTTKSELADLIPVQDAINKTCADALVAAEYAAFRQRWATGIEIPEDPETGKPVEPFEAAVNRVWYAEDEKTKFGEFEATDLRPYVALLEMWIQHLATRSRTPAHYLLGQSGTFPSGESLKATEVGLVSKTRAAMRYAGEGWEQTIRLAFLAIDPDDPRGQEQDSETIWTDPENRTEAEHIDAVLKMKGLDLPPEFLWQRAGLTQNEIARVLAMREREALQVGSAFERSFRATPELPAATVDVAGIPPAAATDPAATPPADATAR
jgi:hypothetical protein